MNNEWYLGLDNFRKCTFIPGEERNRFITELGETDFEPNRDLEIITLDHLLSIKSNKLEVLFSGGADSEYLLRLCKKYKLNAEAVIMKIYVNDFLYNTHDMYYAEKFVRENDIKHRFVRLDAWEFFLSLQYLDWLVPFNIDEPHVASHFWLIEQCHDYPIFGGDWPWVHVHKENKVLSPLKHEYYFYEEFMKSRNIEGMGNFLGHSFEATYRMCQLQMDAYNTLVARKDRNVVPSKMKQLMLNLPEPRIRTHGWNTLTSIPNSFDLGVCQKLLRKQVKPTDATIKWGEKLGTLLNSNVYENDSFV